MKKNNTTALLLVLSSSLLISCTTINNPPTPPPSVACACNFGLDCEMLEPTNEVASVCILKPSCEEPNPTNELACAQTHIPKATTCRHWPKSKLAYCQKGIGVRQACLLIFLDGLLLTGIICLILKEKKGASPQSQAIPASGMSDELQGLVKFFQETAAQLKTAEKLVEPLRDNRKLHYQEAGQWARHFSTIRMTVMTLTITTCVAIIAWKWQPIFNDQTKGDSIKMLATIVGILWGTGVITFWLFTYHTYSQIRRQQEKRPFLPSSFSDHAKPNSAQFDGASLVVPVLTGISLYYFIRAYPCLGAFWEIVLWSFFALSCLFPFGLWFLLNGWKGRLAALTVLFVLLVMVIPLAILVCFNSMSFGCHYYH
jgi:hypothetical protein